MAVIPERVYTVRCNCLLRIPFSPSDWQGLVSQSGNYALQGP